MNGERVTFSTMPIVADARLERGHVVMLDGVLYAAPDVIQRLELLHHRESPAKRWGIALAWALGAIAVWAGVFVLLSRAVNGAWPW